MEMIQKDEQGVWWTEEKEEGKDEQDEQNNGCFMLFQAL